MLRKIWSNHDSFIPVDFQPGFNVVLADRAPGATETHSRNARGKTTLIQAINYCLGGNLHKSFGPLVEQDWSFTLELDLFGERVFATRHLQRSGRIRLGFPTSLSELMRPFVDEALSVSVSDWKHLLGLSLFTLDRPGEPGEREISPRTLLSYVIRTEAVKDPLKIMPQQPAWSSREHIAYLLGLNWELVRDLSKLEDQRETFNAIARATKTQLLPRALRPESDLMLELAEAQRELSDLQSRISGFQIVGDPQQLVARADKITEDLKELRNESVVDRRMIELYTESLEAREDDSLGGEQLADLYAEMQRAFTEEALQSFDTVATFHEKVISNRRRFLSNELEALRTRQRERAEKISELTGARNSILAILEAGGALEELTALHAEANKAAAKVSEIEAALRNVRDLAQAQEEVRLRKAQLRQEAAQQLRTDREKLDSVASRFDRMMRDLYGVGGVLTAEVDDLGYKFNIKVSTSASSGVTRMQLLCFDLTLLSESIDTGRHPGFIVHDSVVFDGVDPRQIAASLALVDRTVHEARGQYICTMNSNDVPMSISDEKWFKEGTRRVVLDTELGGVLGVSF